MHEAAQRPSVGGKFPKISAPREELSAILLMGGHHFNPYVTMKLRVGLGFTIILPRGIDSVIVIPLLFRVIR